MTADIFNNLISYQYFLDWGFMLSSKQFHQGFSNSKVEVIPTVYHDQNLVNIYGISLLRPCPRIVTLPSTTDAICGSGTTFFIVHPWWVSCFSIIRFLCCILWSDVYRFVYCFCFDTGVVFFRQLVCVGGGWQENLLCL